MYSKFLGNRYENEIGGGIKMPGKPLTDKWVNHDLLWDNVASERYNAQGEEMHDLFLPCDVKSCIQHLHYLPLTLLSSLLEKQRFRVVYVITLKGGDELEQLSTALEDKKSQMKRFQSLTVESSTVERRHTLRLEMMNMMAQLDSTFFIMVVHNVPDKRPPVQKEFAMLERFRDSSISDALFVKLDVDTMIVPDRLLQALSTINSSSDKVYAGRANSSCQCSFNKMEMEDGLDVCTYQKATHYCSGFFYITSRKTLLALDSKSFVGAPDASNPGRHCKSSDVSVGHMMWNAHSSGDSLSCSIIEVAKAAPHPPKPGISYPLSKQNERKAVHSNICQQLGSPGGIFDTHAITDPFDKWHDEHWKHCTVFHPAKASHDWLYLWNMVRTGADVIDPRDVIMKKSGGSSTKCRVSAYVLTSPHRVEERQAVRLTWGATALAYGVKINFALGTPRGKDMDWIDAAIGHESSAHGDIVRIPLEETYATLPEKVARGMEHFTETHTGNECDYYFKTDGDSFVRPYQLLKLIDIAETKSMFANPLNPKSVKDINLYIGKIWRTSKVITDPGNQFYLGDKRTVSSLVNKGGVYPPYASGAGYIISARLVNAMTTLDPQNGVGGCYTAASIFSGPEDVQLGICIDTLKKHLSVDIVNAPELEVSTCDERTILDNPVSSHGDYNIFQRQEAHMKRGNAWCDLRKRDKGLVYGSRYPPGPSNLFTNVVDSNPATDYIRRLAPPWEIHSDSDLSSDGGIVTKFVFVRVRQGSFPSITRPFERFCRASSCDVDVYKCISCIDNWYTFSHSEKNGGAERKYRTGVVLYDETNGGGSIFSKAPTDDEKYLRPILLDLVLDCRPLKSSSCDEVEKVVSRIQALSSSFLNKEKGDNTESLFDLRLLVGIEIRNDDCFQQFENKVRKLVDLKKLRHDIAIHRFQHSDTVQPNGDHALKALLSDTFIRSDALVVYLSPFQRSKDQFSSINIGFGPEFIINAANLCVKGISFVSFTGGYITHASDCASLWSNQQRLNICQVKTSF